jgi:PAS domain S-box-containing protein
MDYKGSLALFGTLRDITDKIKYQQEIENQRAFLADIFNSIQDGLLIFDNNLNIIKYNPIIEEWYGKNIFGKKCHEVYHVKSEQCDQCPINNSFTKNKINRITIISDTLFGSKYLDLYSFPLLDHKTSKICGVIVYLKDVTEQKLSEDATNIAKISLEESQNKYKAIVQDQVELICRFTASGTITFVNKAFSDFIGKDEALIINYSLYEFMKQNDRIIIENNLAKITVDNPTIRYENEICNGGECKIFSWVTRGFFNHDNVVVEYQSSGRDVTNEKLLEKNINKQKNIMYTMCNNVSDYLWFKDKDLRFVFVNEVFRNIINLPFSQILGKTISELPTVLIDRQFNIIDKEILLTGLEKRAIISLINMDNKKFWL